MEAFTASIFLLLFIVSFYFFYLRMIKFQHIMVNMNIFAIYFTTYMQSVQTGASRKCYISLTMGKTAIYVTYNISICLTLR